MINKYIFLDRDGTIIKDTYYIHQTEKLKFLPKAIRGLKKLQNTGYRFIIIANQAGVAKGYFSLKQAHFFHQYLLNRLKEKKIDILDSFFCYHEDNDGCLCRKPKPGLVEKAVAAYHINPSKSIFIGDKDCDILLAQHFKAKSFLLKNNQYSVTAKADYSVKDLEEVFNIINGSNLNYNE